MVGSMGRFNRGIALSQASTSLHGCGEQCLAIAPAATRPSRFAAEGPSAAAAGLEPYFVWYVARHARAGRPRQVAVIAGTLILVRTSIAIASQGHPSEQAARISTPVRPLAGRVIFFGPVSAIQSRMAARSSWSRGGQPSTITQRHPGSPKVLTRRAGHNASHASGLGMSLQKAPSH